MLSSLLTTLLTTLLQTLLTILLQTLESLLATERAGLKEIKLGITDNFRWNL